MGSGFRRLVTLAIITSLSFLAAPTRLVAQQQSKAEQAQTCAGLFVAIADDPRDSAVTAILIQYRTLAGISATEAERSANEQADRIHRLVQDGKISTAEMLGAADACTRIFSVALPRHSNQAAATPPRSINLPTVTPPPADSVACDRADKAFTQEMVTQGNNLRSAGPRETTACEDNGTMCGVRRPRSQFYYALGRACDALKARQNAARKVCPAAIVREMTIPAELNC